MLSELWHRLDPLFPTSRQFARRIPLLLLVVYFLFLTAFFSLGGWIIQPDGFVGFDWVNFFSIPHAPPFYPPWTEEVLNFLSWPILIGVTLASFTIAVLMRSVHPLSAVAAMLCLPLFWTLFLGQLEGLAILGVLGIPWLAPLALIKPQVTIFAFLAKRHYLLVLATFLLLSIAVWGLWPLRSLAIESYSRDGRAPQNIGIGWWGLPIALTAIWFSRGDIDLLMLAGCFTLPHLMPYNLLPAIPAVARLGPRQACTATILSWLPLISNWLGPIGWWTGWIFNIWLWVQLLRKDYPERIANISWLLL